MSDSNPLWVQRWFKKIVVEIVRHPKTRFEVIPTMLKEAFSELDNGNFNAEEELKYTQRLNLHSYEYDSGVRAGVLAKLLGKDKGDSVYWYETFTEEYVKSKKCWKRKRRSYSIKPERINLEEYKNLLLLYAYVILGLISLMLRSLKSHTRLSDLKATSGPGFVSI